MAGGWNPLAYQVEDLKDFGSVGVHGNVLQALAERNLLADQLFTHLGWTETFSIKENTDCVVSRHSFTAYVLLYGLTFRRELGTWNIYKETLCPPTTCS